MRIFELYFPFVGNSFCGVLAQGKMKRKSNKKGLKPIQRAFFLTNMVFFLAHNEAFYTKRNTFNYDLIYNFRNSKTLATNDILRIKQ